MTAVFPYLAVWVDQRLLPGDTFTEPSYPGPCPQPWRRNPRICHWGFVPATGRGSCDHPQNPTPLREFPETFSKSVNGPIKIGFGRKIPIVKNVTPLRDFPVPAWPGTNGPPSRCQRAADREPGSYPEGFGPGGSLQPPSEQQRRNSNTTKRKPWRNPKRGILPASSSPGAEPRSAGSDRWRGLGVAAKKRREGYGPGNVPRGSPKTIG